ncbi:type II secretion system protein [Clostridium sp. Marseille-Q2269]|uniref:type II secretion system protein n=1 Tax=Clostridium sp. Marseille-Q2269 TaxID=2942205 RepID=UPI002073F4BF|nr:type II secretion system protein [Clostridium sp. Marseille-Q2269]
MIQKKGFSIIEVLIGISIMSIVSLYIIITTLTYTSNYKGKREETLESVYIKEAIEFINYTLDKEKTSMVLENSIKIERVDDKGYDYIKKDKNNLVISYGSKNSSNTNIICRNIKEFNIKEKGDVIHIKILGKKGKEYKRCLIKKE